MKWNSVVRLERARPLAAGFCLGLALLLGLAACTTPGAGTATAPAPIATSGVPVMTRSPLPTSSSPLGTPTAPVSNLPTPTALTTGAIVTATTAAAAWPVYHSPQAGYSISYPSGWTTQERSASGGTSETIFSSPDSATTVLVGVRTGAIDKEPKDLPIQCKPLKVGQLSGALCQNTATLYQTGPGPEGKFFVITQTGPGLDQASFQRMIESLQLAP